MPQGDGRIPIDAMFGGALPPGAAAAPAGPPPGERPIGRQELDGGPPIPGGIDPEVFGELLRMVLQASPEIRAIVEEELAFRGGAPPGPMGPEGPPRAGMPPPPMPMSASGEPLPGEPGPDAGVTPFLDRLSRERAGGR